jgi:hypothetical protein
MYGLFHITKSNEYAYKQTTTAQLVRPTDTDIWHAWGSNKQATYFRILIYNGKSWKLLIFKKQ